ncbi:MAG TPA: hypothetical protein V6D30_17840 [Leptolyngbyaceae cyanobacterium]
MRFLYNGFTCPILIESGTQKIYLFIEVLINALRQFNRSEINLKEAKGLSLELSIMTCSTVNKFVLTPVVISAAVFAALSLPLAVLGKKPIAIQLQQEPVFQGQLRDVATPYLGLASAMSVGAGIASVALTGWRFSSRKSSQAEAQLLELEQNLKAKEAQLEALKLSEARIEASLLSGFVDEEVTLEQALNTTATHQKAESVVEALVITEQPLETQPVTPSSVTVQAAARQFPCAQTFLGYTQAKELVKPSLETKSPTPLEVEELHTQLQQIMVQMASIQKTLSAKSVEGSSEAQVPENAPGMVSNSWKSVQTVK